uniref:Fatty acid desaturase domain containing protein n=1 Tax=Haemonchus contortus TaxID=6289 RepID=A0A7I4YKJ2_HAECO
MTVLTQLKQKKDRRSVHVPPPKLPTVDEVRKAIPPKCFEKNLVTSVSYLVMDLIILAGLYAILPYVEQHFGMLGYLTWCWAFGFCGCALFVVGHDCGHGSFSEYEWVNDLCGHIAHAPILAPFWPWQKSHRQHHQYTSHLEKDKGHPWVTEQMYNERTTLEKYFACFPLSGWIRWNPIYTVFGLPDGSHFWPWSRLFTTTSDRIKCVVSGTACLFCASVVFWMCDYSVYNWMKYYYIPLTFQGLILVIITYLQHQDEEIEVYEPDEWSFVRGQTQTIDRRYGFGLDTIMHHITDGHVAHHFFFTKIPHYHLMEATQAIKKVLEPLKDTPYGYKSETNYDFFFRYLWSNIWLDYLVHKSKGVLQYRIGVEKASSKKSL